MPEEAAFWGRTGIYGVAIAIVYWFVSYDITGTVLLGMFGVATGLVWALLWRRLAPRRRDVEPEAGTEDEAIPVRSLAPLGVGIGLAVMALGLVYGIWFLVAGLLPLLMGAADWLAGSRHELDLLAREDPPAGRD